MRKQIVCLAITTAAALWVGAASSARAAGENLIVNGSFDDDLTGWFHVYNWQGQSFYSENHSRVSVLPRLSSRRGVLQLAVEPQGIADNQGVKVDSFAVPFDFDYTYHLKLRARGEGPGLIVRIEGYGWLPGVKPNEQPTLRDLRRCYRTQPMVFSKSAVAQGPATLTSSWRKGELVYPNKPADEMRKLQKRSYRKTRFVVVHIVGIAGSAGKVHVDDVQLTRKRN